MTFWVVMAVVLAELLFDEAETRDVRGLREISGHRDEQRPAVLLLGIAVDP